jgi:hypothetical protein
MANSSDYRKTRNAMIVNDDLGEMTQGFAKYRMNRVAKARSEFEERFEQHMRILGITDYEREYRFAALAVNWDLDGQNQKPLLRDRLADAGLKDWKFDFAWPEKKIAFEIEGWGRHQRFVGFREDCIKYNAAAKLGWTVYRVTAQHVTNGYAFALANEVFGRRCTVCGGVHAEADECYSPDEPGSKENKENVMTKPTQQETTPRDQRRFALERISRILKEAPRIGADKDEPEGMRYIQISDTLAIEMLKTLEGYVDKGGDTCIHNRQ